MTLDLLGSDRPQYIVSIGGIYCFGVKSPRNTDRKLLLLGSLSLGIKLSKMLITQKVGFKEWEQQVCRKAKWLNGFSLGEGPMRKRLWGHSTCPLVSTPYIVFNLWSWELTLCFGPQLILEW